MTHIDYHVKRPTRRTRWTWLLAGGVLAITAGILLLLYLPTAKHPTTQPTPTPPIGVQPATLPQRRFDVAIVFTERVQPVLAQLDIDNAQAVDRAIVNVRGHFETARSGSPEFAESIIGPLDSVKTIWLKGKDVFKNWWNESDASTDLRKHVTWNYEQKVTSGAKMRDALLAAIQQLEEDFRANRNRALQAIASSLSAASLPVAIEVDEKQLDEFCQHQFDKALEMIHANYIAEKAAGGTAAAIGLSTVATIVAERAIMSAVTAIMARTGGAVVAGAGGGAAIGSTVPGAGTAIGAAGGFLAGLAVDMWFSHKTKQRVVNEVNESLSAIEKGIIEGDDKNPGVRKVFGAAAHGQTTQLRLKIESQLEEASR